MKTTDQIKELMKAQIKSLNDDIAAMMKSIAHPNELTNYHERLTAIAHMKKEKEDLLFDLNKLYNI